jgi:branched-chain amino acid transport system substrate-binding protein
VTNRLRAPLSLVAVVLVSACGGGSNAGPTTPAAPIKIAVIEPFSGPFGFYGGYVQNSMQVEIDRINASGGVLGHQLELVTRDDQLSPQPTISAVRELAADPTVGLIEGPSFTFLYNAAMPIYEQNKKVNCQVAVADTNAIQGVHYTFRTGVYNKVSDAAILNYASKSLGVKTIGLIYSNDATGQSIDGDLKSLASQYSLTYMGVQFFNAGAHSMLAQVRALMSADAIFISGNSTDAGATAISAQQAGYKGMLIGNNGLQGFTFVESAGAAANGTVFSSNDLDYETSVPSSQWPTAYRTHVEAVANKYGYQTGAKSGVKVLKGTTLSGDCVALWAKAVQKASSTDQTKIDQAWESMSLPASQVPSGISVSFSSSNHDEFQTSQQMYIYKWVSQGSSWILDVLQSGK